MKLHSLYVTGTGLLLSAVFWLKWSRMQFLLNAEYSGPRVFIQNTG